MLQKNQNPEKVRDSNLELYRVIVMLLIVAHQYVVNSGLVALMNEAPLAANSLFLRFFGAWGKTGINCFVLISGYFMCRSSISLKKFMKLVLELELYRVVIYGIFLLTGYETLSLQRLIKVLLPISSVSDGFASGYLLFFLMIPFLNMLIRAMNEKQHLLLMALCLFMYTAMGSVPLFTVKMNYVSWFMVLYLLASYIRLYPKKLFENGKFWGWTSLACVAVSAVSIVALIGLGRPDRAYYFVEDSNKALAVAVSISSFLFFKNLKLRHSKLINALGGSTFGVLLIHANSDAMRAWLWGDMLQNTAVFDSPWLILHAVGSVLVIFAMCSAMDMLRIRFLEKPFFRLWDKHYGRFGAWYAKAEAKLLAKLGVKA